MGLIPKRNSGYFKEHGGGSGLPRIYGIMVLMIVGALWLLPWCKDLFL